MKQASYGVNLEEPAADYALLASAPQQSLEHTNHVKSSSPLRFARFATTYQVTALYSALGSGNSLGIVKSHGRQQWKSIGPPRGNQLVSYRSASVIRPSFRAVLTASPRLVALSFLNML